MLFALRQPATLLGLVLGFVVSLIALSGATRLLDRDSRFAAPFWHPRSWLDPYSVVAAVLAGAGWAPRPEIRRGFGRSQNRQLWKVAVVTFVVPAALGAGGIALYVAAVGHDLLPALSSILILRMPDHGELVVQLFAPTFAAKVALGFGVECLAIAILSLIPIPPLATGVAGWTALPKKPGARQLAYRLLDEHWGVAALLILILLPIGGGGKTPLMYLVTTIEDALLNQF